MRLPDVRLGERRQVRIQTRPVQRFHLPLDRRGVGVLGLGVDFRLGIQGVEHEAGSRGVVDVFELLEMISVATDWLRPAGLESAPGRVVEHIARGPVAAPHLSDGLLGEDGIDRRADRLQRSYVARRRQSRADRRSPPRYAIRSGTVVSQGSADRSARAFSGVVSATKRTLPSLLSVVPAKPRNADSSSADGHESFRHRRLDAPANR